MSKMEKFYLKPTNKTPEIIFDSEIGLLKISGRSIPENSLEFYDAALKWIEDYVKKPQPATKIIINLEYFNTSSSKCLVDIFRKLEKINKTGNQAVIEWYFNEEDEDMQESGEDFKEIIKIPINLVKVKNEQEEN